jgi:hypothetical protein
MRLEQEMAVNAIRLDVAALAADRIVAARTAGR